MSRRDRNIRYALLGGLTLALLLGGAMAIPTIVLGDGYESYKDAGDYRPAPVARNRVRDAYTVKTTRGSWNCPPEFKRHECRRIQVEIDRRRARDTIRSTRLRDYAQRPARRIDYRELDRAERRAFGGKRCAGYFKRDGDARPTEALARGSALKEWRKLVRTSERGGEQFIDEHYSPNFRIGKCRIVGDNGILKRCTAEGLACRP